MRNVATQTETAQMQEDVGILQEQEKEKELDKELDEYRIMQKKRKLEKYKTVYFKLMMILKEIIDFVQRKKNNWKL